MFIVYHHFNFIFLYEVILRLIKIIFLIKNFFKIKKIFQKLLLIYKIV